METVTRSSPSRHRLDCAVDRLNKRIPGMDFSIGYALGSNRIGEWSRNWSENGEARLERRNGSVDVTGTKREILSYIIAMIAGFEECEQILMRHL